MLMLNRSRLLLFCSAFLVLFPRACCNAVLIWAFYELYRLSFEFSPGTRVAIDAIGFGLLALCVYTYYLIVTVGPGSPLDYPELRIAYPALANPLSDELDVSALEPPLDIMELKTVRNGQYRYCKKCSCWKPDRTHHCLASGRCILKMDHYCSWFTCCIGYFNHKYFVQILGYIAVYAWYCCSICSVFVYRFFASERYQDEFFSIGMVILLVVSFAFGFCLTCFWAFLVYLVLQARSTVEFQDDRTGYLGEFQYEFDTRGKKKSIGNIYDLGWRRNWAEVMGDRWWQWVFPLAVGVKLVHARYRNGISFEVNPEIYEKWLHNAQIQDQLNQQLLDYRKNRQQQREQPSGAGVEV